MAKRRLDLLLDDFDVIIRRSWLELEENMLADPTIGECRDRDLAGLKIR